MLLGIILFSCGLYGWVLTGFKPLVHIVPIGGISWILAWLSFAWGSLAARPLAGGAGDGIEWR
jgi:uncharacterized membrane protein YgdD (TMEM256/DUF423 family)